ncbi:MAG TPA: polyphosphate kinase 2 family protein [Aggregatilineales bacterium]|nr:polyphosphate kinase 2 family protein [Aggregatilineales bacterium]
MAKQPLIPPFGKKVHLEDYDPHYTEHYGSEQDIAAEIEKDLARLFVLQELLYASGKNALLVVLQGIDTAGKDGTINHVFRGMNPQGVQVTSFKQPTPLELSHDFLWRAHNAMPAKGYIGVFNRSYYEDVLIVRVHELAKNKVWKARYDQINQFEHMLVENGVVILKFFLHISKDEQKKRLQARLDDKAKQWKFSTADLKEREFWNDYVQAHEDMLTLCHTEDAPWHIVPANVKWYRNLVISRTMVTVLEDLKLKPPTLTEDLSMVTIPD